MRKDGTRFWASGVVTPLRDEGGRLRGFAKIMRDRTDLKRAADAAHERERQLQLLTDHAPVLIAHCDADRRFRFVNRPYAARFGLPPEQVVGRHIRDVLGGPAYAAIEPYIDSALAGERVAFEAEVPYTGSGTQAVRCAYDPEFDDAGRVVGFVAAIVNVTEGRRVGDALRESEERLRTLSDNLPHGAVYQVVADPDGRRRFTYISAGVERLFGVTPAEAMADAASLYGLIHEDDRTRVGAAEEVALRDRTPFDCEFRFWTRSGGVVWVHARSAPRRLPTGQVVWEGILTDVTDRRRAEQTVRSLLRISGRLNSSLDVDALLDALVQEAIRLVDAESGVAGLRTPEGMVCKRYFQRGAVLPLEYCWPPMHGLPGWLLVHKAPYLTNDALTDPQIVHELCVRFGVRSALSTPILDAAGEVLGFFEVHNTRAASGFGPADRDMLVAVSQTAAVAIQNALAYRSVLRAEEALKDADRRKDEFLATLAHELRNPLAPISNGLQVVRLSPGDPAAVERARTMMDRQLTQLVRLVDDLLDVSRITRGKLDLRRELVDVRTVVAAAVETSRPAIEQAGHELAVTLPDGPVFVDGDATRLAQVVANLLNNSAKYTPRGGHITLTVRLEGGSVAVSVADDGIGIPPAMLGRVFEMFTQVDRTLEKIWWTPKTGPPDRVLSGGPIRGFKRWAKRTAFTRRPSRRRSPWRRSRATAPSARSPRITSSTSTWSRTGRSSSSKGPRPCSIRRARTRLRPTTPSRPNCTSRSGGSRWSSPS